MAITNTVSHSRPDLCSNRKLQTNVAKTHSRENAGVTVTGARPCGASVLVKNRFQPLQMLMVDHHIDTNLEEVLQGQNNDKHSVTKAVNAKSIQSNVKPLLASQENKLLVWEKTGFLAKGISEGCYTKNHSESTNVCQATLAGEFSMHRPIGEQILSRN